MSLRTIHPASIPVVSALSAVLLLAYSGTGPLVAQNAGTKKSQLPKPQDLTLETKDGWSIRCTYFPGGAIAKKTDAKKTDPKVKVQEEFSEKPGKSVIPIILLHGHKGQRTEFEPLARRLQKEGHAVMVPDLRGHGDSKTRRLPNGKEIEVDPEDLKPADIGSMILDVDAVKRYLIRENNSEKLNVEQLCVIGSELGALIALNWSITDWNRPSIPAVKVGQDVKALVLISPDQSFKGINATAAFNHPAIRQRLAIMITVGEEDQKSNSDAKQIYNRFERYHPKVDETSENRDLFFVPLATSLQGTKTLASTLPTQENISNFIRVTLAKAADRLPWSKRELKLSSD